MITALLKALHTHTHRTMEARKVGAGTTRKDLQKDMFLEISLEKGTEVFT